jgi:hypothetical protein
MNFDYENKHIENENVKYVEKDMLKKIKYKNSVQIIVNQNIEELSDWIILK